MQDGKEYEKELERLQGKLCVLQDWVKEKGLRVIVVFEGRDAAGKGGTDQGDHRACQPARLPRRGAARAVRPREEPDVRPALHRSTFPPAGEIVIFDRSWYNRAGVEHVMGFCTDEQYERFLEAGAAVRKADHRGRDHAHQVLARGRQQGAGAAVQGAHRRSAAAVEAERHGPAIARKWYEYSRARDAMFKATDTRVAPWFIVRSDDKKRARLNCIAHLLKLIPHKKVERPKVKLPDRSKKHAYDDEATLARRKFVPDVY